MANVEKDIAKAVLAGSGLTPTQLGLRFDRVVGRVLGDLRTYAEGAAPDGVTVLITISAPIRVPAKTVQALRPAIGAMLSARPQSGDYSDSLHGNEVRVRLIEGAASGKPRLIGFVHNPGSAPDKLLDLADRWLRG